MVAPDDTTFEYMKGREFAPKGDEWNRKLAFWKTLVTDADAKFDTELKYDAADIEPMITYGTNPGMGLGITGRIPLIDEIPDNNRLTFEKALNYMGFANGTPMLGKTVDYVFVGSCTNGRIEDLRAFANFVKGKKKANGITAWIVPGSRQVEKQAQTEGIDMILREAGFELRQPGCSACLAMNEDKIPEGKYAVSTTNRNFEGRQGPGSRTMLVSPLTAAAAALTGKVTDPREFL
jgi:3-isopropylmalate/(R)-2-methylmalate dehydratase large subunit